MEVEHDVECEFEVGVLDYNTMLMGLCLCLMMHYSCFMNHFNGLRAICVCLGLVDCMFVVWTCSDLVWN